MSTQPTSISPTTHFQTLLKQTILPRIRKRTPTRNLVEFTTPNNVPTLKLRTGPTSRPTLTLKRLPSGEMSAPKDQRSLTILANKYPHITEFRTATTLRVSQAAFNHRAARDAIIEATVNREEQSIAYLVHQAGTSLTKSTLSQALTPDGPQNTTPRHVNGLWNNIAKKHFINPQTLQAAKDFSIPLTVESHNYLLRMLPLIQANQEGSQDLRTLVRFIIYHLPHRMPNAPTSSIKHLADFIALCLDIPPKHHHLLTTALKSHVAHLSDPVPAITATCEALSQINIKQESSELAHILSHAPNHLRFFKAGGPTWQIWTKALASFAEDPASANLSQLANHLTDLLAEQASPAPPPNTTTTHQQTANAPLPEVINYIKDQAFQLTLAETPEWVPITLTKSDYETKLQLITTFGKPAAVVTKFHNGTISFDLPQGQESKQPRLTPKHLTTPLINRIATQLLLKTQAALPTQLAQAFTSQEKARAIAATARHTAADIAAKTVSTNDPKDFRHLVANSNKQLNDHILQRDTLLLTHHIFSPHPSTRPVSPTLTTSRYNTVALNKATLKEMVSRGQLAPLRAYAHLCDDPFHANSKIEHPSQIISQARRALGFTNPQWRYFSKAFSAISHNQLAMASLPNIQLACQALADANRPDADADQLQNLSKYTHRHDFFKNTQWRQGDPWKAWINLLNQFLAPSQLPHPYRQLSFITDALQYHVNENLPWGHGNWDILLQRAERWHNRIIQANPRNRHNILSDEGKKSRWESLIGPTTIDGFNFSPVLTGPNLASTGEKMGNCLGSYWHSCAAGLTKVFTISTEDRLKAAVELVYSNGTWSRGQIEATHGKTLDPGFHPATAKLASAYQTAFQQQIQWEQTHPELSSPAPSA